MKKGKRLKFGKIHIYFRDGHKDVIPKKLWDDYTYEGTLFVVIRRGAWVYTYNIGDISCIVVDTKEKK